MTLHVRSLQVDVTPAEHEAAVAYWSAALDASAGATGDGAFTRLHGAVSPLAVHVQRLGDAATSGRGRYHLDLGADDPDAEVARLVGLGATARAAGDCRVLQDPAGLLLCVCGPQPPAAPHAPDEQLRPGVPPGVRLHLVVLDVPSDRVEASVRFWSQALGLRVHPVGGRFAAYTFLGEEPAPPPDGYGLLVQDIGDGQPRMHVDLHVLTPADRDREVTRLEELGATRVGGHDRWVVLAAPGGHLHCIVPDRAE